MSKLTKFILAARYAESFGANAAFAYCAHCP